MIIYNTEVIREENVMGKWIMDDHANPLLNLNTKKRDGQIFSAPCWKYTPASEFFLPK